MDNEISTEQYKLLLKFCIGLSKVSPNSEFHLRDKSKVRAVLKAVDNELNTFSVENLETPLGVYKDILLRGEDIFIVSIQACPQQAKDFKQN